MTYTILSVDSGTDKRYEVFLHDETTATTEVELVQYIIQRWLSEDVSIKPVLEAWGLGEEANSEEDQNGYHVNNFFERTQAGLVARTSTSEGRAEFLHLLQTRKTYPMFFLREGEYNEHLVKFCLRGLTMEDT